MRLITVAALGAVSLAALATAVPASAQSPRAAYRGQTETITVIDQNGHKTTRITVRPRSFLDPGTAQKEAFQYHYHDYAVPAQTYAGEYMSDPTFRTDWKTSWSRMPFPTCFDNPGMCRPY
ncbi:MAG TPA: hypothetical protein VLX44_14395 [Xanthobacteraceae bacterium]|nr:hypothetical protein [Xanthobacteraceae bacterium]